MRGALKARADARSPRRSARRARVEPQPGQETPKTVLKRQGGKIEERLSSKANAAAKAPHARMAFARRV
jgi:hypothetical protein